MLEHLLERCRMMNKTLTAAAFIQKLEEYKSEIQRKNMINSFQIKKRWGINLLV